MSKWSGFSIVELRILQDVISNNVENIRSDSVSDNGEPLTYHLSEDDALELHAEALLQEGMVRGILEEIESRIGAHVNL